MSSTKSVGISDEKFRPWLHRELKRALILGALLLSVSLVASWGLAASSSHLSSSWTTFNYNLSRVTLDQHPVALVRTFASRLRESEYGCHPLSWTAPFNVTAALQRMRNNFPEVASIIDGMPQIPRAASLQQADPVRYEERLAAYLARHKQIEAGRFKSLYERDDMFSPPNANTRLGLFVTKLFGLPDALFFTIRTILAGGLPGILLFGTVLALSAMPLWRSRRPARIWLKALVWPIVASTLIWGAILFMAVAAAMFGELTPNTSAIALFTALPLLSVLAKAPLHLAETLVSRSEPWNGVERRKLRSPGPPPPNTTVPPAGGA